MNENEGKQILIFLLYVSENFCDTYGSGTVINYGSGSDFLTSYGSGSTRQKSYGSYGSGSTSGSTTMFAYELF